MPQPSRQRDSIDERVATTAYAQNYERKLLKSGHREIVSPLMVKRDCDKVEMTARSEETSATGRAFDK
jgi:hypothetical protein